MSDHRRPDHAESKDDLADHVFSEHPGIVQAGQELSKPSDAGVSTQNLGSSAKTDSAMAPFSSDAQLLSKINDAVTKVGDASVADPKGPTFPLKERYDPEKDYRTEDGRPTPRGEQLQAQAKKMVDALAAKDGSLSLRDHGKMMTDISKENVSEADKWYLYKQICRQESQGRDSKDEDRLLPGTTGHRVLFEREPPTGLMESGKGDVVRHLILDPTNDAYHDGLVFSSPTWRSGWLEGKAGVRVHEDIFKPGANWWRGEGFGVNKGDQEASFRQLKALHAMQGGEEGDKKGESESGFNAYSRVWNQEFGQ